MPIGGPRLDGDLTFLFRAIASNFYGHFRPKTPNFAVIGAAKAATHDMKVLRTGDFSPDLAPKGLACNEPGL